MHRYLRTFLCLSISLALGQNPEHTVTGLGRDLKTNLFFFPNSTSALRFSHEERSLYVSHDAGRSWKRPNSMPGSLVQDVILHPFNDRMAFVMTNPRDPTIAQTHYRTEDSGQNWIPFELPPSPAHQISLSFHADPDKSDHILYLCQVCDTPDRDRICHRETYITKDAFNSPPHRMLNNTVKCQFAHNSNEFKPDVDSDLVYCIQSVDGGRLDSSTARLYSSTDYFDTEKKVEESCAGKGAKGFITASALPFDVFASTPNFAVLALEVAGEMVLCVSRDLKTWTKAEIPVRFRRNQYFLLPAGRALGMDVYTSPGDRIGTVFVSDESGTRFVESLRDTNGVKELGEVDSEAVAGVPGVALINLVANAAEVVGRGAEKQLQTLITYDGARSWAPIAAGADLCAADTCALHLYPRSVSTLYSKTSSGSPGVIVSVGSAGPAHLPFKDSDTFISTDAGRAWAKLADGAFIYEFGDAGSILVMINSESPVNELQYSVDLGASWQFYDFEVNVTPLDLIPVPEAGSWKFILYAERSPVVWADRYVYIYLDFANMRKSQCTEDDFETWHATSPGSDACFLGSKQPFKRRKPHLDCYVGDTVTGQLASEGSCPCSDADYECDQNFAWDGHACVAVAPEAIPPGMCTSADDVYMGSSGYRKVPGNTCTGGSKDAQVQKSCQPVQPENGAIHHQTFEFPSRIVQHQYFENSTTILVLLLDHTLWQSSNEGYSWTQLYPEEHFTQFYLHKYAPSRAYLLTKTAKFYLTVDGGRTWSTLRAPTPPTAFHIVALRFHPEPDMLLWLGDRDCNDFRACRVEAQYSLNNGRTWSFVEEYVVNCAWAEGTKLAADPREILCESFSNKTGSQMLFQMERNPLSLVEGPEYFTTKKTIFERVVGFAKFSEFLVVAEMLAETLSLRLQISLDGVHFAAGQFPPNMRPDGHAYTILDSSTASLFVHMTMTEPSSPNSQTYWGNILKSNSNGTYFSLSAENVNRDGRGYVDFEKMVGLDGIALINVVSNPEEALLAGHKVLQSKITHNDGSTWKPLDPPTHDSQGNLYPCRTTRCALHVHGYTERLDSSTTFSSSSVVGLIMAVGNVGESLVPYDQSDTFLSRDGGFTWEEVHKDAHLWKIGDSGSIIVIANDEEPTDHVLFSTNEGITWRHYKFSDDPVRVRSIMTVPADTSRRFLLLGHPTRSSAHLAIFLDFTALTSRQCVIDVQDPGHDDFELWSPSDERAERCLFGRTTLYHRRVRERDCYVGIQPKANERVVRACTCVKSDFECEFNYYKNAEDECVLVPGTSSLPNEEICEDDAEYWYERTAYRKIAFSSCEDGERLDQGPSHPCLRYRNYRSGFSWLFVFIPLSLAAVGGYWYCRHARIPPSRILEHMRGMLDRIWSRRERLGYQAVPLND